MPILTSKSCKDYIDIDESTCKITLTSDSSLKTEIEQTGIQNKLSEAEATISVVVDSKKRRKSTLLQEQTSIAGEKNELKTTITKFQTEKDASQKKLIKLREKEQELISTSGTSVSQLSKFDAQLNERNEKERKIASLKPPCLLFAGVHPRIPIRQTRVRHKPRASRDEGRNTLYYR